MKPQTGDFIDRPVDGKRVKYAVLAASPDSVRVERDGVESFVSLTTLRSEGAVVEREGVGCDLVTFEESSEAVNHPPHYNAHPSGVECIDIVEHMNFCLGNAIKYVWRAGLKGNDALVDLKKARWYLDREIARLEGKTPKRGLVVPFIDHDDMRAT